MAISSAGHRYPPPPEAKAMGLVAKLGEACWVLFSCLWPETLNHGLLPLTGIPVLVSIPLGVGLWKRLLGRM